MASTRDHSMERIEGHKYGRRDVDMCWNCRHYVQHYGLFDNGIGKRYYELAIGHCRTPRIKSRNPWEICDRFEHI